MKTWIVLIVTVASFALADSSRASGVAITINGQTPGPTPFISQIALTVNPPTALKSVRFTVTPKPGSATRAVSARYSSTYLERRGYLDLGTGQFTVPVFGLYANYRNTVTLTYGFKGGHVQQDTVTVPTAVFDDPTVSCWT